MEKFNKVVGMIGGGAMPQDTLFNTGGALMKDTDSDIGQSGAINPPEQAENKVIIHMAGGVELHMPIAVAELVAKAINDDCGCGCGCSNGGATDDGSGAEVVEQE